MNFGFGFEISYFDGKEFDFIDDVLCMVFDIFYDVRTSMIWSRFHGMTLKYRSFGDYSVMQINFPAENLTRFLAITPVFDDMPDLLTRIPGIDMSANKTFSVASEYYCLYYRLFASDGLSTTGVVVSRAGQPGNYVNITKPKEGGELIQLNLGFVRKIYQMVRDSQQTRP